MPRDRDLVRFVGDAFTKVSTELQQQLQPELATLFRRVAGGRKLAGVTVSRPFLGYRQEPEKKLVLGVEVRYQDGGYETHIVKIGQRDKVEPDVRGWRDCVSDRPVSSRILAQVRGVELDGDRYAVLYQDAYSLFGLNREENAPLPLEKVACWAVFDDKPAPLSVERVLAQIYTDLGVWLHPGAQTDGAGAARFYRRHLGIDPQPPEPEKRVLPPWQRDGPGRRLRRVAIWVLCGRDKPAARPPVDPPRYLDPVEFVTWALADGAHERLPDTLVGRAHGDLHGRNVLVGVRRSEAEFPVVFDYGEMAADNVLVWDFVKLETELKVRALPSLLEDDEPSRQYLLDASGLRTRRAVGDGRPSWDAVGADRLRAFLAFEELLHHQTEGLNSREVAERIVPGDPAPGLPDKLGRLLALLLRIRKEAAIWLGFDRPQRQRRWRDEYAFALAVYGLLNVRWDYSDPQRECALVAAGAALARMPSATELLADEIKAEQAHRAGPRLFPSYRVPLAVTHELWADRQYVAAREYVRPLVFNVHTDPAGRIGRLDVRPEVEHAIPLIAEAALMEIETGNAGPVEELLRTYEELALQFGDYETLGRLGRLLKDAGDRRWEDSRVPFDRFHGTRGWLMYQGAREVYEKAFEATGDWYTGINAATLALLTHDSRKAAVLARRVLELCPRRDARTRDDRIWASATEGEALLILGEDQKAHESYAFALDTLSPGQAGMANSMYKQLCRLCKALGPDHVGPILEQFEKSDFAAGLTRGYLGCHCAPSSVVNAPS